MHRLIPPAPARGTADAAATEPPGSAAGAPRARGRGSEPVVQRSAIGSATSQVWAAVTRSVSRSITTEGDGEDVACTEVEISTAGAAEAADDSDAEAASAADAADSSAMQAVWRAPPRRARAPEPAVPAGPPAARKEPDGERRVRRRKPRPSEAANEADEAWLEAGVDSLLPLDTGYVLAEDRAVIAVERVRAPQEARRVPRKEDAQEGALLAVIAWGFAAVVATVVVAVMLGVGRAPPRQQVDDERTAEQAPAQAPPR
ncbi:hypothetical protein OOT46_20885 [Aquabacterium sp. A7-Y]|uniref:hypothetical protein n=1 Tax=Aquabacterium sp. A7-Y TaxID=1349605 RepID=UPI00223CD797|nr:hypothetical protein [Aquabacterium sp. A7-Y]MCW7540294.1 hypothetical protein [Aquabacterium sp. A7-Y]